MATELKLITEADLASPDQMRGENPLTNKDAFSGITAAVSLREFLQAEERADVTVVWLVNNDVIENPEFDWHEAFNDNGNMRPWFSAWWWDFGETPNRVIKMEGSMKSENLFKALLSLSIILGGLLVGCSASDSRASDSPLVTPDKDAPFSNEKAILAIEMGWQHPLATPLPYQGVGLVAIKQVVLTRQDGMSIESFTPWGLKDNTLVATVSLAERPSTAKEVSEYLERAQGELVTIDLATGQMYRLRQSTGEQFRTDGRYVVWAESGEQDDRHTSKLFVYDLREDREFRLGDDFRRQADVSNGVVVWQEYRNGGWGIYGQDLENDYEFTVADWSSLLALPYISGEWVIYLQVGNKTAELHAYNIETKEDLQLGWTVSPELPGVGMHPHAISANYIAWVNGETRQMHLYDLTTRQEQVLTGLPADCKPSDPIISESILLFSCGQLLGYDLSQNILFSVPLVPPGDWKELSTRGFVISNDQLVWVINLDGEQRLYTAQILRE